MSKQLFPFVCFHEFYSSLVLFCWWPRCEFYPMQLVLECFSIVLVFLLWCLPHYPLCTLQLSSCLLSNSGFFLMCQILLVVSLYVPSLMSLSLTTHLGSPYVQPFLLWIPFVLDSYNVASDLKIGYLLVFLHHFLWDYQCLFHLSLYFLQLSQICCSYPFFILCLSCATVLHTLISNTFLSFRKNDKFGVPPSYKCYDYDQPWVMKLYPQVLFIFAVIQK
jgi:hypothetical protein